MKKKILLPIALLLVLILSLTACTGNLGKKIDSLTIVSGAPTEVLIGETPDFSQIKLLAKYNDLSEVELGYDDVTISPVDTSRPGNVKYTITYDGMEITNSIEVKAKAAPNTPVAATLTSLEYIDGLDLSIYKDDVFELSDIMVKAIYSDESTKVLGKADLKFLNEIDPKTVGEQTLKVAYGSLTLDITITVKEVVADRIEIDPKSVNTTVPVGVNPDISNLTVYVVYNNGQRLLIAANDPLLDADNFPDASADERDWVITYGDLSTTVKLSSSDPIVTGIKVNSGYSTWVLKGDAYNAGQISATATLSNNLTENVFGLALSAVDTTEAGKKTVTATYTCDDGTFTDTFEIEVVTVTKVEIDTKTFDATTTIGNFDISGLKVLLTLSNNKTLVRSVSEGVTVNGADFDKNSTYDGYITATFQDVKSAQVRVTVTAEAFQYVMGGISDPEQIALWKNGTYQKGFLDSGYGYVVGSNNPFKYAPSITWLDPENSYKPAEGVYRDYVGQSEVLLNDVVVGEDYVTIDENNHTFQFTTKAIGETFVIRTRPANVKADKVAEFTKSLTVTVKDAYNIHEAKELNVITNVSGEKIGGENYGYDQLTAVKEFLGDKYPTYDLKGVVLHNNFKIEMSDLPPQYSFNAVDDKTYLWDHQSLYYHELKSAGTFNFYGNYFMIDSQNIPIVASNRIQNKEEKVTNEDDGYSSSQVFRFRAAESRWYEENFNHTDYNFNIYALGMNDNDQSVSVQNPNESARSRLGVYAFKVAKAVYNFNAVNATRYYITSMPEYDCVTMNLNYTKFYDAWQTHINTWTRNDIDDDKGTSIHANHAPTTININNSFVGKAGGPAIIGMNAETTESINRQSKPVVTIDANSKVFSYVVGNEAWFVANNVTDQASMIHGMNHLFQPKASFTTLLSGNTNAFMNMIMLNMDADFIPGVPGQDAPNDIDGKLVIGETTALDMNDYDLTGEGVADINYGNTTVHGIIARFATEQEQPPVFASSAGGVAISDLQSITLYVNENDSFYKGDYLTLYWYNLGVVLGYNETVTAEPTPPAAPLNTTARAYN